MTVSQCSPGAVRSRVGSGTDADPPAATGGTASDPAATACPSTSCTHANARSPVSVSWRRFSTVTPSSPNTTLIGVTTAAYSASMGVGVPSASTMPSHTKLPSWYTSPKSPP